jgi:TIR domain
MSNVNACFVSYRHTDDPDAHAFVTAFVRQLKKQLKWMLPNSDIYFDENALKVGHMYNDELAFQLCQSACMVMFFSPLHFDVEHPYCAFEYQAMLQLERQRLGATEADLRNKGLIFPVVFRGPKCLPAEITGSRHFENFDHVVCESDFEQRDCQARIRVIADQIYERYVKLNNAGVFKNANCSQFRFPDKAAIDSWLTQVSQLRSFEMPLTGK